MNTYGTLKTAIADWLDREDMTGMIPSFIRLAESDIYSGLRCPDNEFVATATNAEYTLADNQPVVVTDDLITQLPSNFREMRQVIWDDTPLVEISNQRLQGRLMDNVDSKPTYFAIANRQIAFSQPLGAVADWEDTSVLVYRFYGVESLDAMPSYQTSQNPVETPPVAGAAPEGNVQQDNNTTRMLQQHPNMYLYGALRHAYVYLREPDKAAGMEAEFLKARGMVERAATELTGSTVSMTNAYADSLRSY
jgi:hypothetical protein